MDAEYSRRLIGVGGMVVATDGRILLVRGTYGPQRGRWHFPGGRVEPGELAPEAARREVREEAGIDAEVVGLAAVRHRLELGPHLTPIYLIFRLRPRDEAQSPCPDGDECDAARWFTPGEIAAMTDILPITRAVALRAGQQPPLGEVEVPGQSGEAWTLFA